MLLKKNDSSLKLLNDIDEKKQILITHALKHGFTNPSTIKLSQQLDTLLNQIQMNRNSLF